MVVSSVCPPYHFRASLPSPPPFMKMNTRVSQDAPSARLTPVPAVLASSARGDRRESVVLYAIRSVPQRGRCTIRNTQYAIRNHAHSRLRASHPIRNTQYAIRNHAHSRPSSVAPHTQYAIRNTQYATCLTEPCCQYAKPSLNTQSLNTLRKPYWTPLAESRGNLRAAHRSGHRSTSVTLW